MKAEYLDLLPQRPPFLFLEEVEYSPESREIRGHWRPDPDWEVFAGHFPGEPIVPGVILVEAMAQAACILGREIDPGTRDRSVVLVGIDRARFRRAVRPGERVDVHVEYLKHSRDLWSFLGHTQVEGVTCAEARLLAALRDELP